MDPIDKYCAPYSDWYDSGLYTQCESCEERVYNDEIILTGFQATTRNYEERLCEECAVTCDQCGYSYHKDDLLRDYAGMKVCPECFKILQLEAAEVDRLGNFI